jgi:Protein of unknown function (DUF2480)
MAEEILNRVKASNLVILDLEELYPTGERVLFDLKPLLFQELVLKEKDFRDFIRSHNWSQYQDKHVAIFCSADAIVPTWAFMLISISLQPFATSIIFGKEDELENYLFQNVLSKIDLEKFRGAKVVVKGCSKVNVPVNAYVRVASLLRPVASSIMFGEPCSTVPLFKSR